MLGYVALGLGVAAVLIGVAVTASVFIQSPGPASAFMALFLLGSLIGAAALTLACIAIGLRRGRRPAIAGLILAALAPFIAVLPGVIGSIFLVGTIFG